MKSYREIADNVFARRDAYIIEQRRKKQVIARTTVSVGSVALVSLAGFALFKNDAFHDAPLISVSDTTTTVTNTPTEIGDTTTAGDATAPTTDGGIVTPTNPTTTDAAPSQTTPSKTQPPTATTPSKTQPPATAPSKTEPSKTTAPTDSEKVVIAAKKPDNTGINDGAVMSKHKKYVSRLLEEMMTLYEGEDVVYAVIVNIPMMDEYSDDFWNSNEEWARMIKEMDEVHDVWYEEAKLVNPSWDGVKTSGIEIWTDTMRANYERFISLSDERDRIYREHSIPYYETVEKQQFEALKAVSSTEPVDILADDGHLFFRAYYVELTADAINALVERGGYRLCLATYDDMKNDMFDA